MANEEPGGTGTLGCSEEVPVPQASASAPGEEASVRPAAGALTRLLVELAATPATGEAGGGEPGPGDRLGRFTIVRPLGSGGFGVVYQASDPSLRREVALKVIRPRWSGEAAGPALQQEAEAVAQLQHPAIVTLHESGREGDALFLVYELLRGETLATRLDRGPVGPAEAFRVLGEVARALAHAHAHGVVHRDLKPANVFLTSEGEVKVLDFGLALLRGAPGRAAGTPPYVAPEQWRGEAADARADVFAWGVLAATLLGEPAADAATPGAPRRRGGLARLGARARAPAPADRPPDGAALLDGLSRIAERRRRWRLAAWGALAAGAVAAAFLLRPPPAPPLGPFRLAVADAENATGDPALDGLGQLLAEQLGDRPRLAVLDRGRLLAVLRASGHAGRERLDAAAAALAARQAGAAALLVPAARREQDGFAVSTVARQPASGEELFRVTEASADEDGLLPAIERMTGRVLAALREREPLVRTPEAEQARAVTSSLEAHRRYFQGLLCTERPSRSAGSWVNPDCGRHFRAALAVDAEFPLAWLALARSAFWEGRSTVELTALLAPALRLRDRLPPVDQAQLDAWQAFVEGDEDRADAALAAAAAAYPDDARLIMARGDLLYRAGRYADAAPILQAAWALDPGLDVALDELVWALGVLDRLADLSALQARLAAATPSGGTLHAEVQALGWLGRHEAALALARRSAADGSRAAREDLLEALVADDRLEEAEGLARTLSAEGAQDRHLLGLLLRLEGRAREAAALEPPAPAGADAHRRIVTGLRRAVGLAFARDAVGLRRVTDGVQSDSAELAADLAPLLAYAGDVDGALALRPGLAGSPGGLEALDALVTWRREGAAAALPALRRLARADPRAPAALPPEAPAWMAAECAAEAGGDEAALADLRRFQRFHFPLGFWRAWALPRSYLLEAQLLAGLGRRAEAVAALDRLEALWRRADPGQAPLLKARALRARLAAEGAPRVSPDGRGK